MLEQSGVGLASVLDSDAPARPNDGLPDQLAGAAQQSLHRRQPNAAFLFVQRLQQAVGSDSAAVERHREGAQGTAANMEVTVERPPQNRHERVVAGALRLPSSFQPGQRFALQATVTNSQQADGIGFGDALRRTAQPAHRHQAHLVIGIVDQGQQLRHGIGIGQATQSVGGCQTDAGDRPASEGPYGTGVGSF